MGNEGGGAFGSFCSNATGVKIAGPAISGAWFRRETRNTAMCSNFAESIPRSCNTATLLRSDVGTV